MQCHVTSQQDFHFLQESCPAAAYASVPTNAAPWFTNADSFSDPVFVPEWWFRGDRYANLQPSVTGTNPAPLMYDLGNVFRAIAPEAPELDRHLLDMPTNHRHDTLIRDAMQNNFNSFGVNFPFNQDFFNRMTGPDRLRNLVFSCHPEFRGLYINDGQQGTAATAVNLPDDLMTPEQVHFFEVMRHFGMHSSIGEGATIIGTGSQHRPQNERDILDYHHFMVTMLIQRIGEAEFLATAFWGNEDRLNHHVQTFFGPYGFTLENIQYAKTHEYHQRKTTGQRTDHSLLIDSFINAFCKELNLTDSQRAHYKNIALNEITELSNQAREQGLTRQNAFMGVTNGENPTGLEMIPMRRSHLNPYMFPTRQHYLDAKISTDERDFVSLEQWKQGVLIIVPVFLLVIIVAVLRSRSKKKPKIR